MALFSWNLIALLSVVLRNLDYSVEVFAYTFYKRTFSSFFDILVCLRASPDLILHIFISRLNLI